MALKQQTFNKYKFFKNFALILIYSYHLPVMWDFLITFFFLGLVTAILLFSHKLDFAKLIVSLKR